MLLGHGLPSPNRGRRSAMLQLSDIESYGGACPIAEVNHDFPRSQTKKYPRINMRSGHL